jgi:hypothetical protein
MDVTSDADEIDDAFLLRWNVLAVVAFARVGHDGEFQRGGVFADDAADVLLLAVFPAAVLAELDVLPRGPVADLHVINASSDAGIIDSLHDAVLEVVVVHQSAVADRAVEHADF